MHGPAAAGALRTRLALLAWARSLPFAEVREALLPELERLVVAEHAALRRDLLGEPWSPPHAYRWIRYEDPDPLARLEQASRRLAAGWEEARGRPGWERARARFRRLEREALTRALSDARALGYEG